MERMRFQNGNNHIQFQKVRDEEVVNLLNRFKYLTPRLFMELIPWSYRVCARTLERLSNPKKYGRIKKWRECYGMEYIYYIGRRNKEIKHRLLAAYAYCYLKKYYGVKHWQGEVKYSMLRADAYCREINSYIEIDRGTNEFDKVPLYRRLLESDEWIIDVAKKRKPDGDIYIFPRIIVISSRKNAVEERIERDLKAPGEKIFFMVLDSETVKAL